MTLVRQYRTASKHINGRTINDSSTHVFDESHWIQSVKMVDIKIYFACFSSMESMGTLHALCDQCSLRVTPIAFAAVVWTLQVFEVCSHDEVGNTAFRAGEPILTKSGHRCNVGARKVMNELRFCDLR